MKIQHILFQNDPRQENEELLAFVLKKERSFFYAFPEYELTPEQQDIYEKLYQRLCHQEPLAYILGEQPFWSRRFQVNSSVFIPRPETECLVEWVLSQWNHPHSMMAADLGTGSGAIACTLACERPHWQILATDKSLEVLALAKANAQGLKAPSIHFCLSHWCSALRPSCFDLIITNPPYIALSDPFLAYSVKQFEPHCALFSAKGGLADVQAIIQQARRCLKSGGYLVLEHGHQQAHAVIALCQQGGYQKVHSHLDYAHHPRFVSALWEG